MKLNTYLFALGAIITSMNVLGAEQAPQKAALSPALIKLFINRLQKDYLSERQKQRDIGVYPAPKLNVLSYQPKPVIALLETNRYEDAAIEAQYQSFLLGLASSVDATLVANDQKQQ